MSITKEQIARVAESIRKRLHEYIDDVVREEMLELTARPRRRKGKPLTVEQMRKCLERTEKCYKTLAAKENPMLKWLEQKKEAGK